METYKVQRRGKKTKKHTHTTEMENTHFLLFIGRNGCNVSYEATVATTVDFLVIKASGVKSHSLLSLLHQSGFLTLNFKDLSLDI